MQEKVITYSLQGPSGFVVSQDPSDVISSVFGDKQSADELFDDLKVGEKIVYKLIIEKKYTKEDLAKMNESDGDIH